MFQGGLFPSEFLRTGVLETDAWRSVGDEQVNRFRNRILEIFEVFPTSGRGVNEALTEQELIEPILAALGWDAFLPQQKAAMKGRADVPDYLLFADANAKSRALRRADEGGRYQDGAAVLEAKSWQRPLDRGAGSRGEVPSTQMLRYLSRVEILSERDIQWGMLTNGRNWRLYFQGARSRAEEYLDLDLPACAGVRGLEVDLFGPKEGERPHLLKLFYLLFRRDAFLQQPDTEVTFHELALDRGRHWQALVSNKLTEVVFEQVFPELVNALYAHDRDRPAGKPDRIYLDHVRQAALTILYRLLFVLYAEDRGLLPVDDDRYDDYSLRRVRDSVATRLDAGDAFSNRRAPLYQQVKELWALIDEGDDALCLPAYNGGLFDRTCHPIVERVDLPDSTLASVLDALSRLKEGDRRLYINFRDLSVRDLGSIYERLLEFEPVMRDADDALTVRPNPFARKGSGSYYTPDELVELIVQRAVGPLVEERTAAFAARAEELGHERRPIRERVTDLTHDDPAEAILSLRICDPAMGSGHFLAAAVDFLADAALEALAEAEETVSWAKEHRYESPLGARIEAIRERLRAQASEHSWRMDEAHLDDRQIIRRMILKRCVYGVDKNPMAVELAKVSLWLHTFTAGAPLSFLDHHLVCGDSLFGEWVGQVHQELAAKANLLINRSIQQRWRLRIAWPVSNGPPMPTSRKFASPPRPTQPCVRQPRRSVVFWTSGRRCAGCGLVRKRLQRSTPFSTGCSESRCQLSPDHWKRLLRLSQ